MKYSLADKLLAVASVICVIFAVFMFADGLNEYVEGEILSLIIAIVTIGVPIICVSRDNDKRKQK